MSIDYELLLAQAKALIDNESDALANLANINALLFDQLSDLNWVGVYLMRDGQLVLGPFVGKSACTRIDLGRGVCGTAMATQQVQRVDDVHAFEGHIACDSASESEIVFPISSATKQYGVFDIDSPTQARFSSADEVGLAPIARLIARILDADASSVGLA
ncbi:MAG: GAF domain-containing protein [Pseudomonadota bacterium]